MQDNFENNAIRGSTNSWLFRMIEGYMDSMFGHSKRLLFKDHPGTMEAYNLYSPFVPIIPKIRGKATM
jgi:hypothetical protein